jgi:hypothetical protein
MSRALFWGPFCCCCSAWNLIILDNLAWYCEVRIILLDFVYCNLLYRSRERKKTFIAEDTLQRIFPQFVFVCCTLALLVALSIPEAPIDVILQGELYYVFNPRYQWTPHSEEKIKLSCKIIAILSTKRLEMESKSHWVYR